MEVSRAQLAGYALAALLLAVFGFKLLAPSGGRPDDGAPVRIAGEGAAAPSSPAAAEAGPARGSLYVHVAGAVRRPGLYRVRAGSRVAAAVARAGGPAPKADLSAVNLAQPLEDGQQVVVPRSGAGAGAAPGAPGAAGAPAGAGGKISLATATPEQLDGLDGIGPTLAKRIVGYREKEGGFRSVDELREVEGIGEKRFEALREAVRP